LLRDTNVEHELLGTYKTPETDSFTFCRVISGTNDVPDDDDDDDDNDNDYYKTCIFLQVKG